MVLSFLSYVWDILSDLFNSWWTQIAAGLIGIFLVWSIELLPPKYHLHKRINFALKVSNVVGRIDVTIKTRTLISIEEVKQRLNKFLSNRNLTNIKLQNNLTFSSNTSGASYDISSLRDEDIENNFIIITCFKALDVSLFGRIKKLEPIVDELQEILDLLSDTKLKGDTVTVSISISPRWKLLREKGVKSTLEGNNFSAVHTIKNIKIVNKGTPYLKNNIKEVFYSWMVSYL